MFLVLYRIFQEFFLRVTHVYMILHPLSFINECDSEAL